MNGGSCQFARFTTDSRGGGKPSIGASSGMPRTLSRGGVGRVTRNRPSTRRNRLRRLKGVGVQPSLRCG